MKPWITIVLLLCFGKFAMGQEHGHSDIEFSYQQGAIEIEPGAEGFVFEGAFGEGAFANVTSEPGFASESAEGLGIGRQDVIGFNVLGRLYFWDGTQFASPGTATITIGGVGGAPNTVVSGSTGVQTANFVTPMNLVGQADGVGDFHTDLDFTMSPGAAAGGYGLILSLSTPATGISDSPPFGIFLNFGGMEDGLFEAGVEAFSAIVPEPSSSLLLLGSFAFGARFRRRRQVCS